MLKLGCSLLSITFCYHYKLVNFSYLRQNSYPIDFKKLLVIVLHMNQNFHNYNYLLPAPKL